MKKLKLTKVIASALVVASVLMLNPIGANAEWKQDKKGWWYSEGNSWATGWRVIDGSLYYFDTKGYMLGSTPNEFGDNVINSSGQFQNVTIEGAWAFYKQTGVIMAYLGNDSNVVIPDKIDNVAIKSIGNKAFYLNKNITNITIPNGITALRRSAFFGCTGLTSINIPASVQSIDGYALSGCTNLKNISVDSNNITFKSVDGVLYSKNGTKLLNYPVGKVDEKYAIPDGVTDVGCNAFSGGVNLKSIEIPSTVTSIGSSAFDGCKNLSSITIPDGVIDIGIGTFYGCTNLSSIKIPNTVITIEHSAFQNCINLTNIVLPDSITKIEQGAFNGCKNTLFNVKSESVKQLLIKAGVDYNKIVGNS
ncbi:cell wall-binding protein [Clostridium diolis]|uniref:leucine-rich repeat domain-containing protein n=1 Tax=Clostridium diolis TaxID=223919 RepID=UPI000B3FFBCD|nr:leucine-rich repeat domain-containing protein [Clostridium diolis]OVE68270.1 cell wall-binding protein [Clostridium diolis]